MYKEKLETYCTPDFTIPAGRPTGIPLVDKRLQHLCTLRINAEAALRLSKEHMKEGCPKSYRASAFTVGDKVSLQAKQIKIHQQSAKLGPKQLGPCSGISPRYELEKDKSQKRACNCRTTLLVQRQVTHACESYLLRYHLAYA